MKTTLVCADFKPLRRNTLVGFADVEIKELRLTIHGLALHTKDGRQWAQLPAKPALKNGAAVTGQDGKISYFPVMSFGSKDFADGFSAAVIRAVLDRDPSAFDAQSERKPAMARDELDDVIPF